MCGSCTAMCVRWRTSREFSPAPDLILECSAEPSVLAGYGGSPEYLIHTNLTGCFHCLELARQSKADFLLVSTSRVYPVAPVNALSFEETETRYSLLPAQSSRGRQRTRNQRGVPAARGALVIRHDETGGRTHGGRIRRCLRNPVRDRPVRPADGSVADGEGGSGSGGVLGGRALPQSRAEVHRLRRDGQAGSRFPAHRRFLRPGAGPDRQLECVCRAALERGRRRAEQPLAAGSHRALPGSYGTHGEGGGLR